jgi:hypothetical protein
MTTLAYFTVAASDRANRTAACVRRDEGVGSCVSRDEREERT